MFLKDRWLLELPSWRTLYHDRLLACPPIFENPTGHHCDLQDVADHTCQRSILLSEDK